MMATSPVYGFNRKMLLHARSTSPTAGHCFSIVETTQLIRMIRWIVSLWVPFLGTALLTPRDSAQTRPPTLVTVYSFQENSQLDGAQPYAGLVVDKDATLYGTTAFGGTSGLGTVFMLKPPLAAGGAWAEQILYNFVGGDRDGANPYGALVFDANGDIYGTTAAGGTVNVGTVFRLRRPAHTNGLWQETILHDFGAIGDGSNPRAGLVFGAGGK